MISLKFSGIVPDQTVTLGPAPWFSIAGNHVRQGPDGKVVAELQNHQWLVGVHYFTRIDCDVPVVFQCEDFAGTPSAPSGTFRSAHIADGSLFADGMLAAKFAEETRLWHYVPTETYWPTLVIRAAV